MNNYKGILLAGGHGTRLRPITSSVNKHLLPIYDKPMIFYSLSVLMLSGIREVLIIVNKSDKHLYENMFGDGSELGMKIDFAIQDKPNGIAESFIIGEEFISSSNVCLMLGDNIFYGGNLSSKLISASKRQSGASIFAYEVNDPKNFGVVDFDNEKKIKSIEEKPSKPKSNYAVTGLYFYDNKVIDYAKKIKPSKRGELEITAINQIYLEEENLYVEILGRGFSWLDTGTHSNLLEAANFISIMQKRQGFIIACLEEIAFKNGWISADQLMKFKGSNLSYYLSESHKKYLKGVIDKNDSFF